MLVAGMQAHDLTMADLLSGGCDTTADLALVADMEAHSAVLREDRDQLADANAWSVQSCSHAPLVGVVVCSCCVLVSAHMRPTSEPSAH